MADDREPQAAGPGRAPRATRVLLRRGATRAAAARLTGSSGAH